MGNEEDALNYVERKGLMWYRHIRKADRNRLSVNESSVTGRRKTDRPRRSWSGEDDKSMETRDLENGELQDQD